ncbi:hypothetical protein K1719_014811 [Acacia pycnantha]|nr:hypothetical protein K1719_014811 [Acacia pycnantha]
MDQLSSESPLDFLRDDFFIDEILSRLDSAESIIRLGMTSKRFHSLCSQASVLQFKDVSCDIRLIKYLDKFFESRMNATSSDIKPEFRRFLFCLLLQDNTNYIPITDFLTDHLLVWFHKALSLNVQELILKFNGEQVGSDSYPVLRPILNLQNSMIPLKHLRVLSLIDIPRYLNSYFGDWISTYCVSLEELNISDVSALPTKFTITSSSLRVISIKGHLEELHVASVPKLVTLHVTWNRQNVDRHWCHPDLSLEISDVPNLEDFWLEMNWMH